MSAGDIEPPFQVSMNERTKQRQQALVRRSLLVGLWDRFARAMSDIEHALQHEPRSWGDPVQNLLGMSAIKYRRLYDNLVVIYAVHRDLPAVWLTSVEPTQYSPLWIGEG